MIVGQKALCINDKCEAPVAQYYTTLPKNDLTYVIRRVQIGVSPEGTLGKFASIWSASKVDPLARTEC